MNPTESTAKTVTAVAPAAGRKPSDDELDVCGLTHIGKLRKSNQDHFLICALRRQMVVLNSSLPDFAERLAGTERLGFLAMVADGVGGSQRGETASRHAVEAVTAYVAHSMRVYYTADTADDAIFAKTLEEAAVQCHAGLLEQGEGHRELQGMATTLTLWLGVWPRAYLLQVGDSRCYLLRDGKLTQISRDQTMAEELVQSGALSRTDAFHTPWANVLSSALGGPQHAPVVTRMEQRWGDVGMLCSDGLTKHVPDDRIRERLSTMTSARQVCDALLQDALDAGGTDNITVLVGRAVPRA
jgi:protein phosphatase